MIESIPLPEELNVAIGSESIEFAVKGSRTQSIRTSMSSIIFGTVWTAFTMFIASMFLGSVFNRNIISTISGMLASATGEDKKGIWFLLGFFALFLTIGVFMIAKGIIPLFKKGGYFVGTPTRIVNFKRGQIKSSDWEQFNGNITVRGNNKNGSITLEMRTGYMVSQKNGSRYVPNVVYISGIPNVYEIEQICRKRIKENDPTPSSV
jgi:hypothetical protein